MGVQRLIAGRLNVEVLFQLGWDSSVVNCPGVSRVEFSGVLRLKVVGVKLDGARAEKNVAGAPPPKTLDWRAAGRRSCLNMNISGCYY